MNRGLARYSDESADLLALGVYGVQARHVVEHITGIGASALGIMPPYAHATVARDDTAIIVMRSPDLEVEGYDLFVPAPQFERVWNSAVSARATPAGLAVWEIARIEAGRPEWGIDLDDTTIPQEANLDSLDAISFTKGCYTGQEVVARVHFRGHVNRTLRGLRFPKASPPRRATLFDGTGKSVGDVTSCVASPRLGTIGLGMVRREVENGAQLIARWPADATGEQAAGETQVDVMPLPFTAA